MHSAPDKANKAEPEHEYHDENGGRDFLPAAGARHLRNRERICRSTHRVRLGHDSPSSQFADIYFFSILSSIAGSILLMTIAVDPPRWNTFPLTVTFCPANGSSLSFWLLDGVVSAIGQ